MWDQIADGIRKEFSDISDVDAITRLTVRLTFACLLGAMIGWERERSGKSAGLRTHMLVCLGTAFVIAIPQQAGMELGDISRIIQGVMAGVGFVGAGAIIKQQETTKVEGLTSAASVWFVAGIGVAVGMGREASSVLATLLVLVILVLIPKVKSEDHKEHQGASNLIVE